MAKVVPVPDDEYARQKAAIAERCIKAEVTGDQPVRDAISRESVEPGGVVNIDPKTTLVDHLVRAGAVKILPAEAKTPVKAEA